MRLRRVEFGPDGSEDERPSRGRNRLMKSLFLSALLVTLGAVGVSGYIENDLRSGGDRDHLENPMGLAKAGASAAISNDPRAFNEEAPPYLGTTWIQLLAMGAGVTALLSGGWLVMRHAVQTAMAEEKRLAATALQVAVHEPVECDA